MDLVQVGWRLDKDIVEQIQRVAREEDRSVTAVVRRLLRQALKSPSPSSPNGFPPAPICIHNTPPSLTSSSSPPINKSIKDERFEEFWQEYPRKTAKEAARKAWKVARARVGADTIMAGLRAALWPSDSQFIPHPATWLNQGRWDDEAPPPRPRDEDLIPL